MTRWMKRGILILILLMAGALIAQTVRLGWAAERERRLQVEGDSLRGEVTAEKLRADGWEVRFATETTSLEDRLQLSRDSAEELRDLFQQQRVRLERVIQATAGAQGNVSSVARVDTVEVAGECQVPTTWTGEIDDGILKAGWRFIRLDPRLLLDYRVAVPVELVQATTGDGRTLVTGRSPLSAASLTIDSLFVDTPKPVVIQRGYPKWVSYLALLGGAYLGYKLRGEKETVIYRDDDDLR